MTATDWSAYRKCPVCHAALGDPCRTQSGTVTVELSDRNRPHSRRKLRTGAVA